MASPVATDFVRPVDAVERAMPGTLSELAAHTGYPIEQVLGLIIRLRVEGVRVNAAEDGVSRSVGRYVEAGHTATTVYSVDSRRGKE